MSPVTRDLAARPARSAADRLLDAIWRLEALADAGELARMTRRTTG